MVACGSCRVSETDLLCQQLSPYFAIGKYGLFPDVPSSLSTPERRYLPLFFAVLVNNHIFDFKDLGSSIMGLWMLSIVKPFRFLGHENYLAEVVKRNALPFMEGASVSVALPPDYNSNIDFFACAIHHMRRTLRESGSAQVKSQRVEFAKILELVMLRIKEDLALLRPHAQEHELYIGFVRQIISLIKSHGVGICKIDAFFTQPSADYSPPLQDPQLHAAGIVAYGVRLSEKDAHAPPQLFHYLYNNFKLALGNDRLQQECRILGRAMRNAHVATFMLEYMMPAMIRASAQATDCWALLEVYTVAVGNLLAPGCIPKELSSEDMRHVTGILNCMLVWFKSLEAATALSLQQLHIMALLATFANALQPSLVGQLLSQPACDSDADPNSLVPPSDLQITVDKLTALFEDLQSHLADEVLSLSDDDLSEASVRVSALLAGTHLSQAASSLTPGGAAGGSINLRVRDFANTIVLDVRQNWVVTADRVMLRMAAGKGVVGGGLPVMTQAAALGAAGASLQGASFEPWVVRTVLRRLNEEAVKWLAAWGRDADSGMGGRNRRRRASGRENGKELLLLF